jgi:hypothetical protein
MKSPLRNSELKRKTEKEGICGEISPRRGGSTPTPGFMHLPTYNNELLNFAFWLFKRGNRESTIHRKLKVLKHLQGSIEDMYKQVLASKWSDGSKEYALITIEQFSEFKGFKVPRPRFRAYNNRELFVPSPSMVKQLVYRISNVKLRAMCMIAIETGASESEVFNLKERCKPNQQNNSDNRC